VLINTLLINIVTVAVIVNLYSANSKKVIKGTPNITT